MLRNVFVRPPLVQTLLGGLALAMVTGLVFLACGGAKRPDNEEFWSEESPKETRPLRQTQELSAPDAPPTVDAGSSAPLGVRHDLMIASIADHVARCSCLAVETGRAETPTLEWQNGAPDIGPDAMVIAISARGVACPGGPADEKLRRASISAVDTEGADVLVEVEELPPGRPIASGAIIPKPGAGGSVFVRAKNPKLPYARPAPGQRACKVR